jgi:hypothetical protein
MRLLIASIFLVLNLSSCNVVKSDPDTDKTPSHTTSEPDTGKQDYLPLAVGNTWEYSYTYEGEQHTSNGINFLSNSATRQLKVLSYQKTNDTTEVFSLEQFLSSQLSSQITTFDIVRTTNTIGYSYYYTRVKRTGIDSILADTSSLNISGYGTAIAKYKKGVGLVESIEKGFHHVMAGNEIYFTTTTKLVKFTPKN